MTIDDTAGALAQAFPDDPDQLGRLHARLAAAAQQDGVLDVAYRVIDSPVGPLLLAATEQGLIRVAFALEDHDAVLQTLADKVSPRILQRPRPPGRGRPGAGRVLRRPPAHVRPGAGLAAVRRVPAHGAGPPA